MSAVSVVSECGECMSVLSECGESVRATRELDECVTGVSECGECVSAPPFPPLPPPLNLRTPRGYIVFLNEVGRVKSECVSAVSVSVE